MMQETEHWKEELAKIRSIIQKHPFDKTIKWGAEVYTFNGKNVVSYGGFKHHFAIWFYNGVFIKDKYRVLVNAQKTTKSLRQWRFTSIDEIDENKISEYLTEAIEIEKQGKKLAPEKFTEIGLPELFADLLSEDIKLKEAFDKLTPGRRKEYIRYINEAKQDATKLKRLDKIKPIILDGKGLNDQYK